MRNVFQSLCFTFICDNVGQSLKATRKLIEEQKQELNDEVKINKKNHNQWTILRSKEKETIHAQPGFDVELLGWIDLHWVDLDWLDKVC